MSQKLYILIRRDLPVAEQGVQAGHAVAEFCLTWPHNKGWKNGTLVYVSVPDEEALMLYVRKANQRSQYCSIFREPDRNNEFTAIAVLHDGNLFDKLPLWNPVPVSSGYSWINGPDPQD